MTGATEGPDEKERDGAVCRVEARVSGHCARGAELRGKDGHAERHQDEERLQRGDGGGVLLVPSSQVQHCKCGLRLGINFR